MVEEKDFCNDGWMMVQRGLHYLTLLGALLMAVFGMPAAHALEAVTLQLKFHHQFQFAGYYAALEKGYFREAGLDVRIDEGAVGIKPEDKVLDGSAQFGVGSSNLLLAHGAGKRLLVLGVIFQHSPYVLLAADKGSINSIHDAPGKRIMMAAQADELFAYLKKEGVPLDWLNRIEHSFNPQDLIDGKVDLMSSYITNEPDSLAQAGFSYKSFSPLSAGIDFYGDNLFTSERNFASNPDQVRVFREASLRGWKYAMEHHEEIADLIIAKYSQRHTRRHLLFEARQMTSLIQPELIEIGYMNAGRWRHIANTYAELGMLPRDFPLQDFLYDPAPKRVSGWLYGSLFAAVLLLAIVSIITLRFARLTAGLKLEQERRQAIQDRLTQSEQRSSLALEGAGEGVWDWNHQTSEIVYSKRYKEILGYRDDEFSNDTRVWMQHTHTDDLPLLKATVQRAMNDIASPSDGETGYIYINEYRMRCKDGGWKWVLARGKIVSRDNAGKPLRMTGTLTDITDRKLAEEAQVRTVLEASPDVMLLVNAVGIVRYANKIAKQAFAYSDEELIGLDIDRLIPGMRCIDHAPDVPEFHENTCTLAVRKNQEISALRKDSSEFPVEVSLSPMQMSGSAVVIVTLRDITERKQSERELQKSHDLLAKLGEQVPGVFYQFQVFPDGRSGFPFASQGISEIYELTPEQVRNDAFPVFALLHPEDYDKVLASIRVSADTLSPWHFEFRVILPRQGLRWRLGHARPEKMEDGSVLWHGFISDVTYRKLSDDALRQSEERLHEIIKVMPVALHIKDANGRLTLMNRACEEQLGKSFKDLQAEAAHAASEQDAMGLMRDRQVFTGWHQREHEEIIWHASLQENRHVRAFDKPVFDMDGNPAYLICMSVDITDHKRAEIALRELNDHLEERVIERTRELAQAKNLAEEASRAKGKFLANMSHEIRTPLHGVLGMAHLTLRTKLGVKQRDYVEKIHFAGEHLLGIIDDILDFSRIEAGKLNIEMLEFNLDKVVNTLTVMVGAKAAEKGLALIFDIDPALSRNLRGDPLRLAQVLINYTNNAIKFSEKGEITIRAKKLEENANGCLVRFEVQDNGIGIKVVEMANLFQSFQQADTSTTRQYGGSGLGLAISKQLSELMGGDVGVESQPGQGSTFWFTARLGVSREAALPESQGVADLRDQPHQPFHAKTSLPVLNGVRLLVAEDNPFNQQIALELLEDAGAVVRLANNGKEVIELLRQAPFDCVLMDIQMPEMDGLEATRQIRADSALAGVKVIAMTANASSEDQQRCIDAGMDDFMTKPIQPNVLYATIAQCLQGWKMVAGLTQLHVEPVPVPTAAGAEGVIDLGVLARLVDFRPEKIRKFAFRFLQSSQDGIAEMEVALYRKDMETICDVGHRIKSAARTVGAMGFADCCQTLEQLREGKNLDQARRMIDQLRPLLEQIATQIGRDI